MPTHHQARAGRRVPVRHLQGPGNRARCARVLVEAVHYVIPTPAVRVPLTGLLPTAHEVVADGYEFAEHLLASQRQYADEVITATSPLRPGITRPKPVAAKAAKAAA